MGPSRISWWLSFLTFPPYFDTPGLKIETWVEAIFLNNRLKFQQLSQLRCLQQQRARPLLPQVTWRCLLNKLQSEGHWCVSGTKSKVYKCLLQAAERSDELNLQVFKTLRHMALYRYIYLFQGSSAIKYHRTDKHHQVIKPQLRAFSRQNHESNLGHVISD